jgi:hypothetical protein
MRKRQFIQFVGLSSSWEFICVDLCSRIRIIELHPISIGIDIAAHRRLCFADGTEIINHRHGDIRRASTIGTAIETWLGFIRYCGI